MTPEGGCVRILVVMLMALTAVAPGLAAAQEVVLPPFAPGAVQAVGSTGDEGADGYGTDDLDICTIGYTDFMPQNSSMGYNSDLAAGERWTITNGMTLLAGVDCVPNGAEIRQVVFYGRDASTTANLGGVLVVYFRESGSGTTHGSQILSACTTSGSPGDTSCTITLNHTVMRRGNWDGDGLVDVAEYELWAQTPDIDVGQTAIAQAAILWRRQVSPPPETATFNDVPVGAFAFQHIEALAASGITAGCGGGNFCPDAPLTRAQMAVFLAKALGLHWPSGLSF